MSIATLLRGKRICICTGAGGVGKTTTAAAIALGLAARGQRVAVVTIDPAPRLASALGLEQLGNEPRRIAPSRFAGAGVELRGELWAMTLDAKRTFDELVALLAPDAGSREAILTNRIYRELSSAVAGSQEFSAVAKLYELDASRRFDVVVLDTPPSRNALDFLDAPQRISSFFDGRALRALSAPSGAVALIAARGSGLLFGALRTVTGVDLLADLGGLFRVLGGVAPGFARRASAVRALLSDPATCFLIITSPEPAPIGEAIFFRRRLAQAGMPFGGVIVNRMRVLARAQAPPDARALSAQLGGDGELAARSLLALQELRALSRRDRACLRRLTAALEDARPMLVPQLERGMDEVAALACVQRFLFASTRQRAALLSEQAF